MSNAVIPETAKLFVGSEEICLMEGRLSRHQVRKPADVFAKTTDELIRFLRQLQTWKHRPVTATVVRNRKALRDESQSVLEGGPHLPEAQSDSFVAVLAPFGSDERR